MLSERPERPEPPLVLVVDDEPDIREIVRFDLEGAGYRVVEAGGGVEAYELLRKAKVAAVVTDVRMKDGDGLELLDRIKSHDAETPRVFIVSGFNDRPRSEAYRRGADAIFTKPIDPAELLQALDLALQPRPVRWHKESEPVPAETILLTIPSLDAAVVAGTVRFGRGGVFLSTLPRQPKQGTLVRLKIESHSGPLRQLQGLAVVRFSQHQGVAGCGLEFLSLEPAASAYIEGLLADHPVIAFIPDGLS